MTICTQKVIEMHDIEINKSFRLLVLFGNGYKASTSSHFFIMLKTYRKDCFFCKIRLSTTYKVVKGRELIPEQFLDLATQVPGLVGVVRGPAVKQLHRPTTQAINTVITMNTVFMKP